MQLPITIGLHRSRILGRILLALFFLCLGFVWCLPFSSALLGVLTLALPGLAWWAWRQLLPPCSHLILAADGSVSLLAEDQEAIPASVMPYALVHPYLCVLTLKTEHGRVLRLVFTVDSLSTVNFRHLRIWLRHKAAQHAVLSVSDGAV